MSDLVQAPISIYLISKEFFNSTEDLPKPDLPSEAQISFSKETVLKSPEKITSPLKTYKRKRAFSETENTSVSDPVLNSTPSPKKMCQSTRF